MKKKETTWTAVVSLSRGPDDPALWSVPVDVEGLASLVCKPLTNPRHVRDLAALLAEKRPVRRLLPLLERVPLRLDNWAELVACLMQELVLRRVNLTRVPAAVRCAGALRELGHPLAGLPLKRSRGERHTYLYDFPWASYSDFSVPEHPEIEWLPQAQKGEWGGYRESTPLWDAWLAKVPICESRIVSTKHDKELISSAVQHWSSSWAEIIELPRRFDPGEVASLWVNAFLPDAHRATGALNGQVASLGSVVGELLTMAYGNSVFGNGSRGGYGRMKVWQSIAGLVRAPADASVHRVNELAARWTWLAFKLTRREPYWVDRELAIGALSPGGNVLSLLVSHDTD
ncbi:DUF6183 family protein [Rhizohabitans arisaemae]|uniref:DUF6183 family protein n=1 Tax=Rhizohabitans arisaemae TaxID=2720610 RepID=UPI0024B25454|nr:DUF6183 family protein [Rhizohabitans arisaemae]